MKTKTKKKVPDTFTINSEPEQTSFIPEDNIPKDAPSISAKQKLTLSLNEDGTFDIGTMRETTLGKLRQAIASTPGLKPEVATEVMMFPPAMVVGMYGTLAAVESWLVQKYAHVPKEICDRVFVYSSTELELLVPPTARLCQKYAAEWMIKYQDEITVGTLLVTFTIAKVNAAVTLMKAHRANVTEIPKREEPEPAKPAPN